MAIAVEDARAEGVAERAAAAAAAARSGAAPK